MSRKPDLILYAVTRTENNGNTDQQNRGFWERCGAAWKHGDGRGYNLKISMIPIAGQDLVLREPKEDDNEYGR